MTKTTLLRSAAVGAVLTFGMGAGAHAADASAAKPVHHHHHKHHHVAAKSVESPLAGEVDTLKAEVSALEQRLDASNAAAQQAQAAAAQAQASAQAAQSAAQTQEAAINQIPSDVDTAVAKLPKPKTDGWYYKGVKFTPGGFVAAESVYRSRSELADIGSTFGGVPLNGAASHTAHMGEFRESARQSRISGKAEANVTPDIKLTGYGEFDFLGAAQSANSNESNSYNLRIRHFYAQVDWKSTGLSLLAGQTWSLATLNDKGLTSSVTPLSIDAQYVPGFVWARQPQVRVTENFGNGFWAGFSVENAQTPGVSNSGKVNYDGVSSVFYNDAGGALFNKANNYSYNHVPDLVAKVAYDKPIAGHHFHVEGFGLYRDFYDRVEASNGSYSNKDVAAGGGGFGVIGQIIPGLLDGQASGAFGTGIGRYGTSGLADAYISPNGTLQGIKESMLLFGLTLHPRKGLDVYGMVGEEREYTSGTSFTNANGAYVEDGYGEVPGYSISGACETGPSVCGGQTKDVQQATLGFWDKVYSGDFGSFRVGMQYSYTKREAFTGVDTLGSAFTPKGDDNMIFTSIRYYPFDK